jgi:hypothetical protein
VYDWVINKKRKALLAAMGLKEDPWGDIYSVLDPDPNPTWEEQAIEEAKRGPPRELAALFKNLANNMEFEMPDDLAPGSGIALSNRPMIAPGSGIGISNRPEDNLSPEEIKLMRPDHPSKLSPGVLRLVGEFLSGERNMKTGRLKGEQQRGRPKMGSEKRSARTRTHDAAKYDFPAVMQVLREEYRNQTPKDYRDRALFIVERLRGVNRETLSTYLRRSRRGPHRI